MTTQQTSRRDFLKTVSAATAAVGTIGPALAQNGAAPAHTGIRLGLDNFAVRALKWKAPQLIAYAAQLKTDSLFITDFGPLEKQDDGYLGDLRKMAADQGLQIQLGSWSICPTSKAFKRDWGSAEEHLALGKTSILSFVLRLQFRIRLAGRRFKRKLRACIICPSSGEAQARFGWAWFWWGVSSRPPPRRFAQPANR